MISYRLSIVTFALRRTV